MATILNGNENRTPRIKEGPKVKSTFRKSNLFFLTLIILFLIGASLFYVWSRIQVIRFGYEISGALKVGRELAESNKKLRLEIATLKSYTRIEKIAMEDLKMAKPKPDEVIVIR
jgi:cell division protein FtsL